MTTLDPYQQWREFRRADEPPDLLAERIMAALEATRTQPAKVDRRRPPTAWPAPRRRAAVIFVAGAAFVLRVAAAFAMFIAS